MRVKNFMPPLLSAALLLSVLAGCTSPARKLRLGTSGPEGAYSAYGAALSEIIHETQPDTPFEVRTTAGSAANLRLLSDEYLELAIAQSDVACDAYHGTGLFEDTPLSGYSAVSSLYTEACQVIVRADSDIFTMDDLLGKTISIGEEGSGDFYNAYSILECCGLPLDLLEQRTLSYADGVQALGDQQIDALFCTTAAPARAVARLAGETPVRLISLNEHQLDRLSRAHDCYLPVTIPAGTYPGQEQDVMTVGVRAVLLASDSLRQEEVYSLLSALAAHKDAFQAVADADTQWSLQDAALKITIPFHPGAIQFYKEQGIEISEDAA